MLTYADELTGLSSADALKVANATIDAETLLAQVLALLALLVQKVQTLTYC